MLTWCKKKGGGREGEGEREGGERERERDQQYFTPPDFTMHNTATD